MLEKILQVINTNVDKALHFSGGYILSTAFPMPILYGLILAIIAGALKEWYDNNHKENHTADRWDMYTTWLGGMLGFIVLLVK